jgi:hypothetical protein
MFIDAMAPTPLLAYYSFSMFMQRLSAMATSKLEAAAALLLQTLVCKIRTH